MPDVRELADAIGIAFDDLRALPQPGDAGHKETSDDGVLGRATRQAVSRLTGAVSATVGKRGAQSREHRCRNCCRPDDMQEDGQT